MKEKYLQLIEKFYFSFASADIAEMHKCYHPEVIFQDPIFGKLIGDDARDMWQMLIEKSQGEMDIRFSKLKVFENDGSAEWRANYLFSTTNREVKNYVHAKFVFKDGLIYHHNDYFNLYTWSKQAFGFKGVLLGWTPFFKNKVQQQALQSLHSYQRKKNNGV